MATDKTSLPRRYAECGAFVALLIALAWLHPVLYFLGFPLAILFQVLIARRPISELWARNEKKFTIDRWTIAVAIALMLCPIYFLWAKGSTPFAFFAGLTGVIGAVPAAFGIRHQGRAKLKSSLVSFSVAVIIGWGLVVHSNWSKGHSVAFDVTRAPFIFAQIVLMFSQGFGLEELIFRGAIDSHVSPTESSQFQKWASAIFVSALWGLWHLPIAHAHGIRGWWLLRVLGGVLIAQIMVGVPLSFCKRKSGTLVLPAIAHSLIDAYRNLLAGT